MKRKTIIICGKTISDQISKQIHNDTKILYNKYKIIPKLCIIQVGNNVESSLYIKNKIKKANSLNMEAILHKFSNFTTETEIIAKINEINKNNTYHGIIVQLPLPPNLSADKICFAIDPKKDVDGLHPINIGYLLKNEKTGFIPCTALGCLDLLNSYLPEKEIKHKNITIIGRSNIVGRPLLALLANKNATVTMCHSFTKNLINHTKNADIVITAIGKPEYFDCEYFNSESIVIDVGINKINQSFVGDTNFNKLKHKVKMITPVPGGVGPMTVISLMRNLLKSAKQYASLKI